MAATERSLAERKNQHSHLPTDGEREAMAILYEEGWSVDELAMVFEIKEQTVRNHLRYEGVFR